jgi:hypothetical protein
VRPIVSLALLLLPVDARPLAAVAMDLAESWASGWCQTRSGAARPHASRVGLVGLVLLVLATLPSLAYASPPDPSWIPGLYDDADYDDVVVLLTSGTASVGPGPLSDLRPMVSPVRHVPALPGKMEDNAPVSIVRLRAPPAS